jgi:hypothetical protein
LPHNLDEEEIAVYLLTECKHWPYSVPLFELPPEKGEKILTLLSRQTNYLNRMLPQILHALNVKG